MKTLPPTQVRVREKHQITLPASVARAANIHPNDVLEVTLTSSGITLTTKRTERKVRSLMGLMGSMKGVYGKNDQELENYIKEERASWEN